VGKLITPSCLVVRLSGNGRHSAPSPVSTWTGDCLTTGNPSRYETKPPATQPTTRRGTVKWVSAFGLSNSDGDNGGCSIVAAYRRTYGSSWSAWLAGWRPPGALLHSSCEPCPRPCNWTLMLRRARNCPSYCYYSRLLLQISVQIGMVYMLQALSETRHYT